MSISKNVITAGLSGALGKQIVFRQRGGKTIICNYPVFNKDRKPTEKQRVIQERMEEANYYAQGIIVHEQERKAAQVRLNVTRNKLYTALVSEFFKTFRPAEEVNPDVPVLPSVLEANTQFVTYLLNNTNQTPEEIATLAKVSVEFVMGVKGN